jgi:hypothetical protein
MSHGNTREYYERRARSANRLAEQAASPGICEIHRKLARHYEQLAAETPDADLEHAQQ